MHSANAVAKVLALREEGLGAGRIARRTALPLSTVRDWLADKIPKHGPEARRHAGRPVCEACGCDGHCFEGLSAAYVYLLGLST